MLAVAAPSYAALDVGDAAPNFTASAALGGKVYKFTLSDSLAKGPVVLYFFPAAFSVGCSLEAHEFAEAIGRFEALGATVSALPVLGGSVPQPPSRKDEATSAVTTK